MAGGARVEQEVRGVRRHCPTPRRPRCPRVVAVHSLSQGKRAPDSPGADSDPSGFAVSLFRSNPPGNTHPQPDHATIEAPGLSGSGDRTRFAQRRRPTAWGPPFPSRAACGGMSAGFSPRLGSFQIHQRFGQPTLIFGKGALISVNAEVLRPREEMGASEPEIRVNMPRAPGS